MLKKTIIFIALIASMAGYASAADNKVTPADYYHIGEEIVYDVNMGGIHLGKARLNVLPLTELNGHKANLITFTTKLTNFYDQERIYCEPGSLLPLRVERDISGWFRAEKIVETYDQEHFVLSISKKEGKKISELVIKTDSPIHNAIILPFYVRGVAEPYIGWSFGINLGNAKYEVKLISIEDIRTAAGRFKAYYLESVPEKFQIWISADSRRIPLKIKGMGGIGYTLLMKKYSLK